MAKKPRATWIAWLDLIRVPGLPSAWSNVLVGFLLVQTDWQPLAPLVCLLVATSCFFSAGMALNDWFDREQDRQQRAQRPLPAGEISAPAALGLVLGLLLVGWSATWLAGWLSPVAGAAFNAWPPLVGAALVALIWLYDGPCKSTFVAPLLMGACRTANVVLGASVGLATAEAPLGMAVANLQLPPAPLLWQAVSLGVLIAGVTVLARQEACPQPAKGPLWIACGIVLAGLVGLMTLPWADWSPARPENLKMRYLLVLGLMGLSPMRRVLTASVAARPESIQAGVISVLRSLVLFDAAVCYLAKPDQPMYALLVAALLVPAWWWGRWLRTT